MMMMMMICSYLNSYSHTHIPLGGQVQCWWRLVIGRSGSGPPLWVSRAVIGWAQRQASHVVATECRGSLILTGSPWAAWIDICFVRWKDARLCEGVCSALLLFSRGCGGGWMQWAGLRAGFQINTCDIYTWKSVHPLCKKYRKNKTQTTASKLAEMCFVASLVLHLMHSHLSICLSARLFVCLSVTQISAHFSKS